MKRKQKHSTGQVGQLAKHKDAPILLDCPKCHSFISEKDLEVGKKIAKCSYCNHVFSFSSEGYWDPFGLPTETQPIGLEMLRLPSFLELKIDHYRSSTGIWPTIGFTFLWNTMLFFFMIPIFLGKESHLFPFISLHLMAGLFLIWNVFARLFNETIVYIDDQNICIRTKPFKIWNRSKCIPTLEIKKLSTETIHTEYSKGQKVINHVLYINKKSGDIIKLLDGLDKKTLFYLEKEIERFLHIGERAKHKKKYSS